MKKGKKSSKRNSKEEREESPLETETPLEDLETPPDDFVGRWVLRPTKDLHIAKYQALLDFLDHEIDRKSRKSEAGTRGVRKIRKEVVKLEKDARILLRIKRPTTDNKALQKPLRVSPALQTFLKLKKGERITQTDVNRAFCVYIFRDPDEDLPPQRERWAFLNPKFRDLRDPDDRRIIRPDATLSKILGYADYVKEVKAGRVTIKKKDKKYRGYRISVLEDPTLYRWTLTKLYSRHFLKEEKERKESKEKKKEKAVKVKKGKGKKEDKKSRK
jgi:chromatin remodeling complex protein RSC6